MKSIGIIPARYASTRFPAKPLVMIGKKSMINHVYDRATQSNLDEVCIATDDIRIAEHIASFGGKFVMTSILHQSGTERCAEAVENFKGDYDIILNIQGDEPFIEPQLLNQLIESFNDKNAEVSTIVSEIHNETQLFSPHTVKVIMDVHSYAMYFSRSPIPYVRETARETWVSNHKFYSHIGIYAFRSEVLKRIVKLSFNALEKAESLEQLRWLANGYRIKLIESKFKSISIDTLEDLEIARSFFPEHF